VHYDSLARFYPLRMTVFRSESESLFMADTTGDSGYATFVFGRWTDSTSVDTNSISRAVVDFPNAHRAIPVAGQTRFAPMKYDNIDYKKPEVDLLLDPAVWPDEFTIGDAGVNVLNFVVMNDMHVGGAYGDFGTTGWNDVDDGSKQGREVVNDSLILEYLLGYRNSCLANFMIALGDISSSGERSEFNRADKLLSSFTYRNGIPKCPWFPVIGNHDMWPYTSDSEANWNEFPRGTVFGEELGAYYDSFYYWFPDARSQVFYSDGTGGNPPSGWPTYYFPAYFDLQGFRFIIGDFNTRDHALNERGVNGSAELDAARLDTFAAVVREARTQKRRLVVLAHHPFNTWPRLIPWNLPFDNDDYHKFGGVGEDLLRYYPESIPDWIGGHVHGWGNRIQREELVKDGNDPIGNAKTLRQACSDGWFGYFSVWDVVKTSLRHDPVTHPPTVTFHATFRCYDGSQAPSQYRFDFGDGSIVQTFDISALDFTPPPHTYPTLDYDCLYRATVTVVTSLGRYVTMSDTVRVYAPGSQLGPWTEQDRLPGTKPVYEGGCMAYDAQTNLIYASKGNRSGEFYAFDPAGTWTTKQSIPLGGEGKQAYYGSAICSDGQGNLYLTKGYNTRGFWKYSTQTQQWAQMANVWRVPYGDKVKQGSTVAFAQCYGRGYVYLLKGGRSNEFGRYDPVYNTWTQLADAPSGQTPRESWGAGSWLVADPTPGSRLIYAFKAGYQELYSYHTETQVWTSLRSMPTRSRDGSNKKSQNGCAAWYNGTIYAFKGLNTGQFWRYFPNGDSWHECDPVPLYGSTGLKKAVNEGSALAGYPGSGVYGLKGNRSLEFWKYVPLAYLGGLAAGEQETPHICPPTAGRPSLDQEQWLTDGVAASNPRWNHQGTMVCYSETDTLTGCEQIYQCQYPAPSNEQRVVNINENCEKPVYSPDGQLIAFQLDDTVSDYYQLCVTPATGSLLGGGGLSGEDGDVVSAKAPVASDRGLGTVPFRGQSLTDGPVPVLTSEPASRRAGPGIGGAAALLGPVWQITFAAADHCYPEWSQDNQWLCCERDDENGYTQIWRVPASGGIEEQLTFGNSDHFLPSYLNPDEIVFTYSPNDGYDQIAKVNVTSHQVTVLSSYQTDHERPDPSSDGLSVTAEASDSSGNSQVVWMSAAGGSEIWLTNGTSDITSPDWCPDNQSIFAVRWTGITSQIVSVDAATGGCSSTTDTLAIRDNPDASYDSSTATAIAAYEREEWSSGGLLAGGRRRHGTGVYLSKSHRYQGGGSGTQSAGLRVLAMDDARPNPTTGRVAIRWQVPVETDVSLRVYNTAGQLVKVLANGRTKPGSYTSVWDGTDTRGRRLANGVYFCTLNNCSERISRKAVLTR